MKRFSGLFVLLVIPFFLFGCSGSEESSYSDENPQEEFKQIEEANEPVLPDEDKVIDEPVTEETPRMPEEPALTAEDMEKAYPESKKQESLPAETPPVETPVRTPPVQKPVVQKPVSQKPVTQNQHSDLLMWSVQIGAFKEDQGAIAQVLEAKKVLNQPIYKAYDPVTGFYKVTVGSFTTQEQAARFKQDVRSKGYPDAFTVEVRR